MSYKMIDVSEFQGTIDWKKVRTDGIETAMIRVGGRFGNNGRIYKDSRAEQNLLKAKEAGLHVGVYFFSQAVNAREGREEALFSIQFAKNYEADLPIAIDTEYLAGGRHNIITRTQRTEALKAFCDTVKEAGYTPMIYGGVYWFSDKLDMEKLQGIDIWLAQWTRNPSSKWPYTIWQYADNGRVSGIRGNVDMNYLYKEYWKKETPKPDNPKEDNKKLSITKKLDKETVKRMQQWLGTYVDGVIDGQHELNKKYLSALESATWTEKGSPCIVALQRFLNGKGFDAGVTDGLLGPKTIKALQKFLNKSINAKLVVDGYLGPKTAAALQEYLNLL